MKNAAIGFIAVVVAIVILFWLLKLALRLALIAVVAAGAIALFYGVRKRIGGGGDG